MQSIVTLRIWYKSFWEWLLRLFVRGVCYIYIDSIVERRGKGRKKRKRVESREVCSSTKKPRRLLHLCLFYWDFTIIGWFSPFFNLSCSLPLSYFIGLLFVLVKKERSMHILLLCISNFFFFNSSHDFLVQNLNFQIAILI